MFCNPTSQEIHVGPETRAPASTDQVRPKPANDACSLLRACTRCVRWLVEDSLRRVMRVGERCDTAHEPFNQSSCDLDGLVSRYLCQSIVPFIVSVSDTKKSFDREVCRTVQSPGAQGGYPRTGCRFLQRFLLRYFRNTMARYQHL